MEMLLIRIDKAANEVISKNLTMDVTEQQMRELIYEEEVFARSISRACPTSFIMCC
ncbi:hypothetical protein RBU61_05600 [Tissierella sp. MB52-C2]|uniref:hypothetical protein n=1 Tax=Tissierella sp. MB52-C2 TaxID=3070999 RepID=UPI00280B89FB|nr:hypothetical protein [Tissierella sp. MB52-C2]WMM26150.1 hypothetical protein RBU61_05600 [Tissierella sp. MB52-C2]